MRRLAAIGPKDKHGMNESVTGQWYGMLRIWLVAAICLASCTLGNSSSLAAESAACVTDEQGAEFFPLMAWDYAKDEATLQAMRDCGINAIAFVPPHMLDACQRHGLRAIVFDEGVSGSDWSKPFDADQACQRLPALIQQVDRHPAVYGYHLKDEPGAGEYPALAKACAMVKELAPGKWPYINLLPGDGPDYDAYVEQFIQVCQPTTLSYDRYVLSEDGSFAATFWSNLAVIRAAAIAHELPFHNIVLTAAHWHYREATATDIRMQTFGSLVYGARGLAYYKFCSESLPILQAPDLGNFRMGPLDPFGEKTVTWDWLRNTNRQILNLAPTLQRLRSDDVYHFGSVPERNHGSSATSLIRTLNHPDFVAGDFTHEDGSRHVMIVNKSLQQSHPCVPEFNVPVKDLEYVSPISGRLEPFPKGLYWLAPGQGVLLRLNVSN
ncbi:MAG: hypothetical protein ACYC4U_03530 [Pirellulaceae bacterium]